MSNPTYIVHTFPERVHKIFQDEAQAYKYYKELLAESDALALHCMVILDQVTDSEAKQLECQQLPFVQH